MSDCTAKGLAPLRPPRRPGMHASFGPDFELDPERLASMEEEVLRHAVHLAKKAIRPGALVAGRYRVRRIVERSARGVLVEAEQEACGRLVWLRVVIPSRVEQRVVARLHREARVLATLETEHVARILDVGQLPDGTLYFARELVVGESLAELARDSGGLSLDEALLLFLQLCEAVQEAHANRVVLRDISADAVRLVQRRNGEPVAKLCDLGTCALQELEGANPTRLRCDSRSAAPELLHGEIADERSDLWSLGCLLYEMLAGGPAFSGRGPALMLAVAHQEPTPLPSLRPDLPRSLLPIVGWMLHKDPAARPSSVTEVAHALARFVGPQGRAMIRRIAALDASTIAPPDAPTDPGFDEPLFDGAPTMPRSRTQRRASAPPSSGARILAPKGAPVVDPSIPVDVSLPGSVDIDVAWAAASLDELPMGVETALDIPIDVSVPVATGDGVPPAPDTDIEIPIDVSIPMAAAPTEWVDDDADDTKPDPLELGARRPRGPRAWLSTLLGLLS